LRSGLASSVVSSTLLLASYSMAAGVL
jgi:hypothetical protein